MRQNKRNKGVQSGAITKSLPGQPCAIRISLDQASAQIGLGDLNNTSQKTRRVSKISVGVKVTEFWSR